MGRDTAVIADLSPWCPELNQVIIAGEDETQTRRRVPNIGFGSEQSFKGLMFLQLLRLW